MFFKPKFILSETFTFVKYKKFILTLSCLMPYAALSRHFQLSPPPRKKYPLLQKGIRHHDVDGQENKEIRSDSGEISIKRHRKGQREKYTVYHFLIILPLHQIKDERYHHITGDIAITVRYIKRHGACGIKSLLPFILSLKEREQAQDQIQVLSYLKVLHKIRRIFILSKDP